MWFFQRSLSGQNLWRAGSLCSGTVCADTVAALPSCSHSLSPLCFSLLFVLFVYQTKLTFKNFPQCLFLQILPYAYLKLVCFLKYGHRVVGFCNPISYTWVLSFACKCEVAPRAGAESSTFQKAVFLYSNQLFLM